MGLAKSVKPLGVDLRTITKQLGSKEKAKRRQARHEILICWKIESSVRQLAGAVMCETRDLRIKWPQ